MLGMGISYVVDGGWVRTLLTLSTLLYVQSWRPTTFLITYDQSVARDGIRWQCILIDIGRDVRVAITDCIGALSSSFPSLPDCI